MSEYGDALVCVRYRYDVKKRKQFKTIEIIVDESDWTPPPPKFPERALVGLRIGFQEKTLQEQAKVLGARWDREKRLWLVRYGLIAGTKLEKFIVLEATENSGNRQKFTIV